MGVSLEKVNEHLEIPNALKSIIGGEYEAFRFVDRVLDGDGPKLYDAYKVVTPNGSFVLKKSEDEEDHEAERRQYGLLRSLPVPKLYGAADGFLLLSFVEGDDLLIASDEGIAATAKSLSEVMNAYPMGRDHESERYLIYLRRLEKRAARLEGEPLLKRAFSVFFERQKEIPLTLSNADLLPINVIFDGEKTTLIDWGFGGFMPYALDIARFISHGRESGKASPFRMTDAQKKLFCDLVYDSLEVKPPREVYDRDLLLAEFNEHVEILEYYFREKDAERGETFNDYYHRALDLAEIILKGSN